MCLAPFIYFEISNRIPYSNICFLRIMPILWSKNVNYCTWSDYALSADAFKLAVVLMLCK